MVTPTMVNRLDKLLQILAAEPGDAFTLYGVAQEYAKQDDLAKAVSYYDQCLAADPAYCYAYYHKARILIDHDQGAAAAGVLKQGLAVAKKAGDGKAMSEMQSLLDVVE
jgi:tetratricopeptide (TPR) repeat protein